MKVDESAEYSERRPLMARKYSTGTKTLNGIPRSPPRAAAIAALNAISAQPFFARENGFFESLLARDSVGRSIRSRIMLGWGLFSITFSYSCLRFVYGHSSEESFFIATTTLTTIGYGSTSSTDSREDHLFLLIYFIFFVFPFIFLQYITFTDDTAIHAMSMKSYILSQSRQQGSTPARIYGWVVATTFIASFSLLFVLLIAGAFCFQYFSGENVWQEGLFYAVTSATTIGYGNVEVSPESQWGYYAVGVYAIVCNYTVALIVVKLAALWAVTADNIQQGRDEYRSAHIVADVFDDEPLEAII